jgi:hypothetical protein
MSKYTRYCGDYRLTVESGGTITLDTGVETGSVVVTGDLIVQGDSFAVNTQDLTIEDRIITLNKIDGATETNVSPTLISGLEINRGTDPSAYWVYDEAMRSGLNNSISGGFVGRKGGTGEGSTLLAIQTSAIDTTGADLYLINQGNGIVSVEGVEYYQERIFQYDLEAQTPASTNIDFTAQTIVKEPYALVNAKGVADYVQSFFTGKFQTRIESGTIDKSYVAVHDNEEFAGVDSQVEFGIDGNVAARFFNNRAELQHIRFIDTSIETTSSDADLILAAPGPGSVRIDDTLYINPQPYIDDPSLGEDPDQDNPDKPFNYQTNPNTPTDGVKIYTKDQAGGDTGIYFVNSSETRDELISRNRALLFSMIF